MSVARPNIATGWPERQPNQSYILQTVSAKALPILKEVLLTLALGRCPLKIWVFVASEFILGWTYCEHLWTFGTERCVLQRKKEKVSIWSPRAQPRPSSLAVAKTCTGQNRQMWARC
jgi:hypothetical protein